MSVIHPGKKILTNKLMTHGANNLNFVKFELPYKVLLNFFMVKEVKLHLLTKNQQTNQRHINGFGKWVNVLVKELFNYIDEEN